MARHTEEEAANPLDEVGEEGPDSRRCARPRRRRPPASSRCSSRAGSRWCCCRSAIAGAYLFLHAAGHILLLFIIAGLIALLLNPFVALLQQAAHPARGGGRDRDGRACSRSLIGLGFLLANPISDQVSSFQNDVPGYVDDANAELADLQDWLDRKGIDLAGQAGGRDRAADDRRAHHRRRRRRRRASPATPCRSSSRPASR